MTIPVKIYGIVRVVALHSEETEITKSYFANEKMRDEALMLFIADFPEDEFYPFEYEEEVEV